MLSANETHRRAMGYRLRGLGRPAAPPPAGWTGTTYFRDAVRSFWLAYGASIDAGGQGGSVARLADALSGSASLFEPSGRSRLASRQPRHRP